MSKNQVKAKLALVGCLSLDIGRSMFNVGHSLLRLRKEDPFNHGLTSAYMIIPAIFLVSIPVGAAFLAKWLAGQVF